MVDEKKTVDKTKENKQSTELSGEQVEKVVGGTAPLEYGLTALPIASAIISEVSVVGPSANAQFEELSKKLGG